MQKEIDEMNVRDNSSRAKQLITIFWAIIAVNVVSVVTGYYDLELMENRLNGAYISEEEITLNDLIQGVVGLVQFSLYIITAIFFLNWFRRAYGNAQRVANYKLSYEEKMAAWSFAIPFVNLVRPYKICKEMLNETQYVLKNLLPEYQPTTNPSIIGLWWGAFLIKNFIGQIASRLLLKSDTLTETITATRLYMISDVIDIVAALITLYMVLKISKEEQLLYKTVEYRKAKNELIVS